MIILQLQTESAVNSRGVNSFISSLPVAVQSYIGANVSPSLPPHEQARLMVEKIDRLLLNLRDQAYPGQAQSDVTLRKNFLSRHLGENARSELEAVRARLVDNFRDPSVPSPGPNQITRGRETVQTQRGAMSGGAMTGGETAEISPTGRIEHPHHFFHHLAEQFRSFGRTILGQTRPILQTNLVREIAEDVGIRVTKTNPQEAYSFLHQKLEVMQRELGSESARLSADSARLIRNNQNDRTKALEVVNRALRELEELRQ